MGSCGQESVTLFGTCGVVPDGSFYRFRSRPSGDQLSGLLDERRRLLEADGHKLVWILNSLDTEGRGRSFPVTVNRVEMAEEVGFAVVRDETDQVELLCRADTPWFWGDRLRAHRGVFLGVAYRWWSGSQWFFRASFKMLANSEADSWRNWVFPTLARKRCSTEDSSGQMALEVTILTSKERCPSQWWHVGVQDLRTC